jgi:hypothetical protein
MESISKFLQGIEDERRKTLATRMQPLVSYLDQAYKLKTAEEQNQRMVGIATSDALERAKQSGYADDEIETFRQSLSGIKDPGSISGMFSDFEQAAQARRILAKNKVPFQEGLSTSELVRLANESETTRTANKGYETKAKELGKQGAKTYQDLITQGSDPATSFGEASKQASLNEYKEKAAIQTENILDRKSSGSGKAEKPVEDSRITGTSKKDYQEKAKAKFDPEKKGYLSGEFVYMRRSDGTIGKTKIRVDDDGYTIRWADTGSIANLDHIVPYGSLTPQQRKEAKTIKIVNAAKPKAPAATTTPVKTADDFLKKLGY